MYKQNVKREPKRKITGVRRKASDWYRWLWLSPFLTIPTLIFLYLIFSFELFFKLRVPLGILGSSLWHLVLLIPSLDKKSAFVRWHGRQMLILAGLRTAVPFIFVLTIKEEFAGLLVSVPILIIIWLLGNLWGQQQAKRGDCSFMRWTGREKLLPGPEIDNEKTLDIGITDLMKTIRFSKDPHARSRALEELQKLGMVEEF